MDLGGGGFFLFKQGLEIVPQPGVPQNTHVILLGNIKQSKQFKETKNNIDKN